MANLHAVPEPHPSTAKYRQADSQPGYVHQEFPKLVYKGKNHKSVANAEEQEAAIAEGFDLKPPAPPKEEE